MPPAIRRSQVPVRPDGVLGEWRDNAFHFDSPDAEKRWAVEAYRRGVHADNWQQGQVLDDKTRDVVLSGLGGATAPVYQGPDGKYRFANPKTVEPDDVRALRAKSFHGVKLQDLKGPAMPGEDVIATRFAASRPANDNAGPAANDNAAATDTQPKKGVGRFAAMAEAQKEADHPSLQEALQAIDDGVRLLANGATLGYADNIAAAGNALFGDRSFAEDYQDNLGVEKEQTAAARERRGTVGALIEAAPGMIPIYGDALSLIGDGKRYIEHPETATPENILATVVTALPMTPNVLGAARKVENAAEDAARLEAKTAQKIDDLPEKPRVTDDPADELPASKPDQSRLDLNDPASIEAHFKRPITGNEGPRGHGIERHVGKTPAELQARYDTEPHISSSSTFPDLETAEEVVHGALNQNKQAILDWLAGPQMGLRRFDYTGTKPIGFSIDRNGNRIERTNAIVVLEKDGFGGFHYYSFFPSK